MLIRLNGGRSGIKEYLVNGHKEGREYTRDQLDQRVMLDGDLDMIDGIIRKMNNEGQKYIHGTMSFLEDDISEETLRAITEEIKRFTFAAYDPSEYAFYAEAHLPKIKNYTNNKTGKEFQRKPHIHYVIPKRNLTTGKALHPYGYEAQNIKFINALQEHINNKFGLASPKDHRRVVITDASELISRYKGDTFANNMIELRKAIFDEVLARRIETMADFKALLSEYGKPGEGRGGDYLTVQPEGRTKKVRLKDAVFEAAFIELPTAEKLARLEADAKAERLEATPPRATPQELADLLTEWNDVRAHEVKLLNSGDRKLYATYQASSPEEKRGILNELKQAYAAKYEKEIHNEREQHRQRNPKSVGQQPAPAQRGSLRTLSELDVVRVASGSEVLLPRDVPGELVHEGAEQHHALRRFDDRVNEAASSADNVVNQMLREAYERKAQAGATTDEWTTIKRNLDATRLLAYVSKSHGVAVEHYEVTKGKDGADRVKCGPTKHYSVSDFLTKEMHLSWAEAQPILREAYAGQLADVTMTPRQAIKTSLWDEFQAWRGTEWKAEKEAAWSAHKEASKVLRATIKADFDKDRKAVYAKVQAHQGAERRAAVSVLRMQRVEKEKAAAQQAKADKDALKGNFNQRPAALYRQWLAQQAAKGNAEALRELRRQQKRAPVAAGKGEDTFAAPTTKAPVHAGDLMTAERITYSVSDRGDVTYKRDGKEFMRDEARMVVMLDSSKQDNIETALRLAVQKFGSTLSINGGEDFQRRAVEVAVERGLRIDFKNEALQTYKLHLEEQAKAKFKVHQPPTKPKEKATVSTTPKPQAGPAAPAPAAPVQAAPAPTSEAPAGDALSSIASKRQGWMQDRAAQLEQQRQREAEERQRRELEEQQRRNKPKGPGYEPSL